MKIAQVTPVYPPYRGGMGGVAKEYADRLRELGHTVEVFTPALRLGNAGFLSWKQLQELKAFDIVHLHYPFYGAAEQLLFPPSLSVGGMVLTYHMDATAPGLKGRLFDLHRRTLQPLVLRRAKRILVSSLDYARHSALRQLADDPKVIELPFGIDVTRFHPVATPAEAELRRRLHIPEGVPVLLFVGGMDSAHAFKGMPVLLKALESVHVPFHLVAVGDGNLREGFEAAAKSSLFGERVHFVGSVPNDELPAYYRASQIHMLPSTSAAEAFGLVALEAAASGIPTIASDLPGVRTVVKDRETGLLASPGDADALATAISRLLKNGDEREKLGAAARRRAVEQHAWAGLMERLVKIYEDCHRH